ncbi:hypothetical protein N0V93_005917 [Gnomoniopsis smithogilvyi]|uniref:Heterokaryon incompatibility domain-containing protein n=1 Tax=Gnomoniopsis smithogilvyi TaxID=1191159 RepID=A0A9W8YXI4_9PEZI|nr:hypothetical protein N0V93_005917 [Gnomoniopsis smithogilvyi]
MSSPLLRNHTLRPYVYEPLTSDDSIRVISLHPAATRQAALRCSIVHYERCVELSRADNSRHYSAVSYAWGEPNFTEILTVSPAIDESMKGNSVNAESGDTYLRITPNVDALLRAFRKAHKPVYLWVDAICLNQDDDAEKTHQVPLMGEIYAMAKKVLVWLGNDDSDSRGATAFGLIRQLNHTYTELNETEEHALTQLLERSWFTRRWIIQEVSLARRSVLCWGQASIDLSWLMRILPEITKGFARELYAPRLLQMVIGNSTGDFDLLSALWELDRSECSDPQDRVAALMGLVAPDQRFQVNYGTEDWRQTYQRLVAHLVNRNPESGWVILLHLFDFGPANSNSNLTGKTVACPSWVPDWSGRRRSRLLPSRSPHIGSTQESEVYLNHEYDFVLKARIRQRNSRAKQMELAETELRQSNTAPNLNTTDPLDLGVKTRFRVDANALHANIHRLSRGVVTQVVTIDGSEPHHHLWETTVHKLKSFSGEIAADSPFADSQVCEMERICTFLIRQLDRIVCHNLYAIRHSDFMGAFQDAETQPDTLSLKQKQILTGVGLLLCEYSLIQWEFFEPKLRNGSFRPTGLGLGPRNTQVNDLLISLPRSSIKSQRNPEALVCLHPTSSTKALVSNLCVDWDLVQSISEASVVGPVSCTDLSVLSVAFLHGRIEHLDGQVLTGINIV